MTEESSNQRAAAQARNNAVRRLIAAHRQEFDTFYAEECRTLGVLTRKEKKLAKLEAEAQALRDELGIRS